MSPSTTRLTGASSPLGLLLSCLLAVLLGTSAAHADTELDIDCNHSDIDNEGTNNTITVKFYNGGTQVGQTLSQAGPGCSSIKDANFEIDANEELTVTHIIVSTNGDDGFYIDEAIFDGATDHTWGSDNGKGWCLSTDPSDATGSWNGKVVLGCVPALRFTVGGGVTEETQEAVDKAGWAFVVDCHANGDLGSEETKNAVNAKLYVAGSTSPAATADKNRGVGMFRNYWQTKSLKSSPQCGPTYGADAMWKFDGISGTAQPTYIQIQTDGDDGFFIDEAYLYRDGTEVMKWGIDNDQGWCLSTDPADASGSWAGHVSGCHTRLKFHLDGRVGT